jgi:single-stranded-DNA-specific exonuclease
MTKIQKDIKNILKNKDLNRTHLSLKDIPSPEEIPNMEKAVNRILANLKVGKKMRLIGDYDADGVFGTTIVSLIMKQTEYNNQYDWTIPDRFIDGYGVSKSLIDKAIEDNIDFIVTVDNGIGAVEAIDYAIDNGIEVIITDHHTPGKIIPNSEIIVNLKYKAWDYDFIEISGATVAWYMCALIVEKLNLEIDMRKYLDLVAITIISDVMPLDNINLCLFKEGLKLIKNRNRRIYELIFDSFKNKTLNETDIGFQLVPMINAVGRIDNASKAVEVFLADNMSDIKKGVDYLFSINNKRKKITDQLTDLIIHEAIEQVKSNKKCIIIKKDNLHEGIVGILAGKLAEKFKKPTYVFGWNRAKQCWKGSGRTSGGIHLYNLTSEGSSEVIGFGGHKGAVGVAISKEKFEKWKEKINKASLKIEESLFYEENVDYFEIQLESINSDLINLIESYGPFGEGFNEIVFKTKCYINIQDSYKEGLHWKVKLSDNKGNSFSGFFFHDKNAWLYNNKEKEIFINMQRICTKNGEEIEIHCTMPFENMEL